MGTVDGQKPPKTLDLVAPSTQRVVRVGESTRRSRVEWTFPIFPPKTPSVQEASFTGVSGPISHGTFVAAFGPDGPKRRECRRTSVTVSKQEDLGHAGENPMGFGHGVCGENIRHPGSGWVSQVRTFQGVGTAVGGLPCSKPDPNGMVLIHGQGAMFHFHDDFKECIRQECIG